MGHAWVRLAVPLSWARQEVGAAQLGCTGHLWDAGSSKWHRGSWWSHTALSDVKLIPLRVTEGFLTQPAPPMVHVEFGEQLHHLSNHLFFLLDTLGSWRGAGWDGATAVRWSLARFDLPCSVPSPRCCSLPCHSAGSTALPTHHLCAGSDQQGEQR